MQLLILIQTIAPSTLLTENTNNLNTVIGTANYDIGHVFTTGGGGVATLNGPCTGTKRVVLPDFQIRLAILLQLIMLPTKWVINLARRIRSTDQSAIVQAVTDQPVMLMNREAQLPSWDMLEFAVIRT